MDDARVRLLTALAALEIPDCGCPHLPLPCQCQPCRECRRKHPDRWQASDCEAGPTLPAPCSHVLDADHRVDCEAWASLLARHFPEKYRDRPRPAHPTAARPGSEAKIDMMAGRYERGEHLYHPHDAGDLSGVGAVGRRGINGRELEVEEVLALPAALVAQRAKESIRGKDRVSGRSSDEPSRGA